jgi:hypothetical protein
MYLQAHVQNDQKRLGMTVAFENAANKKKLLSSIRKAATNQNGYARRIVRILILFYDGQTAHVDPDPSVQDGRTDIPDTHFLCDVLERGDDRPNDLASAHRSSSSLCTLCKSLHRVS